MNGISLRPWTTASLCIATTVSCSPIRGVISRRLSTRLKRLLDQLPGRFWAPRSIVPSGSISPGQPTPMKGATRRPPFSA